MTIVERLGQIWRGLERLEKAMDFDPLEDLATRMARLERDFATLKASCRNSLATEPGPKSPDRASDARVAQVAN